MEIENGLHKQATTLIVEDDMALADAKQIHFDKLNIDLEKREVNLNGENIILTSSKFDLLTVLAKKREAYCSEMRSHDNYLGGI